MKDVWFMSVGWSDDVRLTIDGKDIELFVGDPHRNYKTVYLTREQALRLAKRLKKMAGE